MKDFPEYVKENLDKLTRDDLIYLIREYDHTWSCIGETLVDQSKCHISDEYAIDKISSYLSEINRLNPRSNRLNLEIKLRKGEITPDEYRKIVLGGD
ncbi:MAG: hypothetical protein ACLUQX_15275 [Thomasclavelia spiroformis]|jgi:hypothetical protein